MLFSTSLSFRPKLTKQPRFHDIGQKRHIHKKKTPSNWIWLGFIVILSCSFFIGQRGLLEGHFQWMGNEDGMILFRLRIPSKHTSLWCNLHENTASANLLPEACKKSINLRYLIQRGIVRSSRVAVNCGPSVGSHVQEYVLEDFTSAPHGFHHQEVNSHCFTSTLALGVLI